MTVAMTERWRDLRLAGALKLAGCTIVLLYSLPWFVFAVAETREPGTVYSLIAFSSVLVAVALLGLRHPRVAAWILIVPSLGLYLLGLAFGGALVGLLLFGPLLVAGLLFLIARFRDQREEARRNVRPRRF